MLGIACVRPQLLWGLTTAAVLTACASDHPAPLGAWSAAPALPVPRFESYAAVHGGRLYHLGGITGQLGDISTALPSRRVDVFDPGTRSWAGGPDLPEDAPKHHLAVATWNDLVYVVGGFDGILDQRPNEPFRPIAVAYAFDGATWKKLAPPPLARGAATAQAIDGKIYVSGGAPTEGQAPYDELDVYDIASDRWTTAAPMPTAREHAASCAAGGLFVVVGGWVGTSGKDVAQAATEAYDPHTNTWTKLPPMPTARGGLGAAARGSACHVVGGEDWALPPPGTFGAHEILDVATGSWRIATKMPTARHGLGLAWLDDQLYAVGGGPIQGNSYTDAVEVFAE